MLVHDICFKCSKFVKYGHELCFSCSRRIFHKELINFLWVEKMPQRLMSKFSKIVSTISDAVCFIFALILKATYFPEHVLHIVFNYNILYEQVHFPTREIWDWNNEHILQWNNKNNHENWVNENNNAFHVL